MRISQQSEVKPTLNLFEKLKKNNEFELQKKARKFTFQNEIVSENKFA